MPYRTTTYIFTTRITILQSRSHAFSIRSTIFLSSDSAQVMENHALQSVSRPLRYWLFSWNAPPRASDLDLPFNQKGCLRAALILYYPRMALSFANSSPLTCSNFCSRSSTLRLRFSSPLMSRMIFPSIIMIRRLP